MKTWLTKEYVVRRKNWIVLLESVIDSIIFTLILYFCVTKYNDGINEILNSIKINSLGFTFSKIMFPIILIVITMLKLGFYVINNENFNYNRKKKK